MLTRRGEGIEKVIGSWGIDVGRKWGGGIWGDGGLSQWLFIGGIWRCDVGV